MKRKRNAIKENQKYYWTRCTPALKTSGHLWFLLISIDIPKSALWFYCVLLQANNIDFSFPINVIFIFQMNFATLYPRQYVESVCTENLITHWIKIFSFHVFKLMQSSLSFMCGARRQYNGRRCGNEISRHMLINLLYDCDVWRITFTLCL